MAYVPRSHRTVPRLTRRFGQHHLVGEHLCRPLVDWLQPAGQTVIEIGPGGGVLTRALVAASARVIAVERDLAWAFHLGRAPTPGLRLMVGDALDLALDRLPAGTLVAGNLPFNVGTKIIESLLPYGSRIPKVGVMLQKEVAERLVARPGDPAYGALSVLVRCWADARWLGTVRPGSFRPPPKVAGAYVGLRLREPAVARADMPWLTRTIKAAFAQRRKTLRNSLGTLVGTAEAVRMLRSADIAPDRRAETLDLADFVRLAGAGAHGERVGSTET